MSKATLIWVSDTRGTTRVLALPKSVVIGLVTGFVVLAVATACTLGWVAALRAQACVQGLKIDGLQTDLADQRILLEETRADNRALSDQKNRMASDLERIRDAEGKVRRFLGMAEQVYEPERSHQGGMAPGDFAPASETGDAATPVSPGGEGGPLTPFDPTYASTLESGLGEVVARLEERDQQWRRLPMTLPVRSEKAWLSCGFGWRKDPFTGTRKEFHRGIDIAGPWKDPVHAPADGTVIGVGKDRLLGNYIKLRHTGKVKTLYGHLASIEVKRGQKVKRGDVIARMGNTGRSTGTHLHYSVSVDGKYVDPRNYILDRPFRTLTL